MRDRLNGLQSDAAAAGWTVPTDWARFGLLVFVLAPVMLLGACREEEQNRTLNLEKGTYQGAVDTPLAEEERQVLRQRARNQRGSASPSLP